MAKLDRALLSEVKQAFVPQPGGQAEPVAGAGPMTAGLGAPMGGDPAAAGAAPAGDPAAMAGGMGMPPPGLDPAMAGMMGGAPAAPAGGMSGSSQLTLTVDDLIKLFKVFQKNSGGGGEAMAQAPMQAPAPQAGGQTDAKLDKLVKMLEAAMGTAESAQGATM